MPFSTDSEGVTVGIEFDANEASASKESDRLAAIIGKSMEKAFAAASKSLVKDLTGAFKSSGKSPFNSLTEGADAFAAGLRNASKAKEIFDQDLAALNKRIEATRAQLGRVGAQPELFAIVNAELQKVLKLQASFNSDLERISNDPELLAGYGVAFQAARATIFREVSAINELNRSLASTQAAEGNRALEVLKQQNRERLQAADAARSAFVVTQQREAAQTLAETRAASQSRLQSERAFARTRIELLRFTLGQIRVIERSIGAIFKGTAAVVSGAFARVEGTIFRIGNVFRRSNSDFTEGLQPALLSRERLIERSFTRQNAAINTSLLQQSQTIQRFEAQASRGVAGVVSGRSSLGGLLGGGAAIGGTFILLDKLKEGFDESVNLNESLNKTRQIFGDATDEIIAFSETSVEALFSTRSAALAAAANFGIFGTAAGLSGKELATFSKDLVLLATDLASFNNTSVDDAVQSLGAALRGESEPIRKYGVLLDAATLQQRAFNEGITDEVRILRPGERVLAAYAEIMDQTRLAQGDAARTADDFANSSRRAGAAATEAFAALASFAIPIATQITNVAYPAFVLLTDFIRGDVGPVLEIVRDGLIGAGAALGGLLAARAAAEAIQFLAIALRAATTPLGLFITAVAALGAAFNVLRSRSPQFRLAMESVADTIRNTLGQAVDIGADALARLVRLVDKEVIPRLIDLARLAESTLRRAFEVGFGFVENTVLPALFRLGDFLARTLLPVFVNIADTVTENINPAFRALTDAATTALAAIEPYLAPTIAGFEALGGAIANAFRTGDLGGIVDGLRTLGSGIGESLGRVGELLIDTLRPQLKDAVDFVADFFKGIDYATIGKSFLEIVELFGRTIGRIVSDRRTVLALEAIVGAAVIIGGQFILGFIQGVATNLDDIGKLLGGQLEFALGKLFEVALKAAVTPKMVAGAIVAAFIAPSIFAALTRPSDQLGRKVGDGFIKGFTARAQALFKTNEFGAGFFGGFGNLEEAARKAGDKALAEQARYGRRLALLGQEIQTSFVGDAISIDTKKQFDALVDEFGRARVAGASFRESMNRIFNDVKTALGSVGTAATTGLTEGLRQAGGAGRSFVTNVGDLFRNSLQDFRQIGGGVGQAIGGAIVSGVGAALSGQALGNASSAGGVGLGLAGIISSALFAGASVGGGPAGVAVGGVVATLGLVTAAFTASGREAKIAAARVDDYTDILVRFNDVASSIPSLADEITEAFRNQSAGVQKVLVDAGVTAQDLARQFVDGPLNAVEAFKTLASAAGLPSAAYEGLIERAGGFNATQLELQNELRRTFNDPNIDGGVLLKAFTDGKINAVDFLAATKALQTESQALGGALGEANFVEVFNPKPVEDTHDALRGVNREIESLGSGPTPIFELFPADEIDNSIVRVDTLGDSIGQISEAIAFLNEQSAAPVLTQIDAITGQLGIAQEAANVARESLTAYLTGDYTNTVQEALDESVLGISAIGSAIEEAGKLGGLNTEAGNAKLRQITEGFDKEIANIIQVGVNEGFDTVPELDTLFAPLRRAINEADLPAGAKERLLGQIDAAIGNPELTAGLELVSETQADVDRIQDELDGLNAQLQVELVFSPAQIQQALRTLFGSDAITINGIVTGQQTAAAGTPFRSSDPDANGGVIGASSVQVQQDIAVTVNGATAPIPTADEVIRALAGAGAGAALAAADISLRPVSAPQTRTGGRLVN